MTVCVDGFNIKTSDYAHRKSGQAPLCAVDPSAIDQLAQIDPSAIQAQITSALPDLSQAIDSSVVMVQMEKISTYVANNVAVVNGGIGVSSFLLGTAVSGKGNAEEIESLEKSIADRESNMEELRLKLNETRKSKDELSSKLTQYEEQMFELENEYEKETGKIKKNFQETLEEEKDKMRAKVRKELQFSMDIKMNKERSEMLQEKLEFVKEVSYEKNLELSNLRFEKFEMEQKQKNMVACLQESENEVEKLRSLKNRKGFWPAEVVGLRIAQSESGKDIERLMKELEEMEKGLTEANEEIKALSTKRNFWSFITKESPKEITEIS